MVMAIEQHVDWIADCLSFMAANELDTIEATVDAEDAVDHVNQLANATLFPRANSWYMGANVPGKPRVFPPYVGGFPQYRSTCDDVAADGYRGPGLPSARRLIPGEPAPPVPPCCGGCRRTSTGPALATVADREALARFGDAAGERARRVALPPAYVEDRRGTAAALRAIDALPAAASTRSRPRPRSTPPPPTPASTVARGRR